MASFDGQTSSSNKEPEQPDVHYIVSGGNAIFWGYQNDVPGWSGERLRPTRSYCH